MARLASRLTAEPWGLRVPLVGAPMAGVSGGELAAAVTRAGGLGFIAVGHGRDLEGLRQEVELYRRLAGPTAPLALGFLGYSSCAPQGGVLEEVLREHGPEVVQFFAPAVMPSGANIRAAKAAGARVLAQIGTLAQAQEALDAGADGVIAQGREAGGHGMRPELGNGTLPLARAVAAEVEARYGADGNDGVGGRPLVLAAGGISDGRGLAACLALGCDGVVLGTRLWASVEGLGHDSKKAALVAASGDGAIRTRVFDLIQNSYSATPWPLPYDSTGALGNATSAEWHGREEALQRELDAPGGALAGAYRAADSAGDAAVGCVHAGEGVGLVDAVLGAGDIVRRMEAEAVRGIGNLSGILVEGGK
eukprot:jgi/Tetstr1/438053/TSEL_026679.t1